MLVLGGTGSGKSILCKAVAEECLRYNMPVIAIDLQGDIVSLGESSDFVPTGATPPHDVTRQKLAERMDFKVWTPGSTLGIPLSFAPDMSVDDDLSPEDRIHSFSAVAESLARILGDSKEATVTGLHTILEFADHWQLECSNLADLAMFLKDPPPPLKAQLGSTLDERKRKKLLGNLEAKMGGVNRLLYGMGQPIDVSELFGCREPGPAFEDRARLSVIYLAHLSEDQQQEFLALLFQTMYRWMLRQGSDLSGLLYFDEISPFIPAGMSKPPAKEPLMDLLRQARKYGLCTLLATQSPGDIDYKALGQFGTMALGKIDQQTALSKVEAQIRAYPNVDARSIIDGLSQPPQGRFVFLNGDHLDAPTHVQGRWLATADRVIDDRTELAGLTSQENRESLG
jgi:DNA helicase HerA-like ATPase